MGNCNFCLVSPHEILNNPEALHFLEIGAEGFGGIFSVAQTLQNYVVGKDLLVLVKKETKLLGTIHLTVTQQDVGRVLTSVLLGGVQFREWARELRDFYYKLATDNQCDEFYYMGRAGFAKLFPELKEAARIYRVIL